VNVKNFHVSNQICLLVLDRLLCYADVPAACEFLYYNQLILFVKFIYKDNTHAAGKFNKCRNLW